MSASVKRSDVQVYSTPRPWSVGAGTVIRKGDGFFITQEPSQPWGSKGLPVFRLIFTRPKRVIAKVVTGNSKQAVRVLISVAKERFAKDAGGIWKESVHKGYAEMNRILEDIAESIAQDSLGEAQIEISVDSRGRKWPDAKTRDLADFSYDLKIPDRIIADRTKVRAFVRKALRKNELGVDRGETEFVLKRMATDAVSMPLKGHLNNAAARKGFMRSR